MNMKTYICDSTKSDVDSQKKKLADVEAKFQRDVKEIQDKIRAVESRCRHESTTYHPDPSGNSDSFYRCNICGHES